MDIWVVGTLSQLFRILKKTQGRNKVVTGKTPFFVIGSFCTFHSICIKIGFSNVTPSILVFSAAKRCFNFSEKVFAFQKICVKTRVLKTFKISSDCHIKTYRSFKWSAILKIPSTDFWKNLCSFC